MITNTNTNTNTKTTLGLLKVKSGKNPRLEFRNDAGDFFCEYVPDTYATERTHGCYPVDIQYVQLSPSAVAIVGYEITGKEAEDYPNLFKPADLSLDLRDIYQVFPEVREWEQQQRKEAA